jgi:glycosyltransferase involved in cell wall biosynthesis
LKVLFVHQHFKTPHSGGAIRSYYLAKALVDAQIQVEVISGGVLEVAKTENYEGITVHYLPIPYDNKFGFFERIVSFFRFTIRAIAYSRRVKNIDYCYAISVPLTTGLVAIWLKKIRKIPFHFEVGDLWPEAPIQMGFVKNYFLKLLLSVLEHVIYQSADLIVALSPAIKNEIEKRVKGKTIVVIPNFADCDFYQPMTKLVALEEKFGTSGKFVVSYIGAMGLANGLDYLLECANASRKAGLEIQFLLCGAGALRERLISNAKQLGLQNLTFIDLQNREGVREIMNVTDATFICYKRLPVLETGSPNKFFDGLAAGKLIIVNFGGWIKKEVEEARCGIFVDPSHPTDFVKKVSALIGNGKELKSYQSAARQLAERKYDRKLLSHQFSNLFLRK